jgi:hypothetical protein
VLAGVAGRRVAGAAEPPESRDDQRAQCLDILALEGHAWREAGVAAEPLGESAQPVSLAKEDEWLACEFRQAGQFLPGEPRSRTLKTCPADHPPAS